MKFLQINFLTFLVLLITVTLTGCSSDDSEPMTETALTITASDFSVTIDENPAANQSLGTISASTNSGMLSFSIIDQSVANAFSINSSSGELFVDTESAFDFETNPTILGNVLITNGDIFKNVAIGIILNDLIETNIFDGDVLLTNQEEVNSFGKNNYTEISGTLTIESLGALLTSLSPLKTITKIGGSFNIRENENLSSLEGLHNIMTISGDLKIFENPILSNIDYFDSLTSIGGFFDISFNHELHQIEGFNSLTTIGVSLSIGSNNALENISGLNNLETVFSGFNISVNPSLISCSGFTNLQTVGGSFFIIENNSLTSLSGLEALDLSTQHPDSNKFVAIQGNSSLSNLNFFQNTTRIDGRFIISDNDVLTNLDGLQSLETISDYINIGFNDELRDLNGLSGLLSVGTSLSISWNVQLNDFCGLQSLLTGDGVDGDFFIGNNAYNPTQQDIMEGNCSQ